MIIVRRIYDPHGAENGTRYFVERLYPRGIKKEVFAEQVWLKDIAPSTELRQWFNHDPARWHEFQKRYSRELDEHRGSLEPVLEQARHGNVILLYSAKDQEHNNALVLKDYLEKHLQMVKS